MYRDYMNVYSSIEFPYLRSQLSVQGWSVFRESCANDLLQYYERFALNALLKFDADLELRRFELAHCSELRILAPICVLPRHEGDCISLVGAKLYPCTVRRSAGDRCESSTRDTQVPVGDLLFLPAFFSVYIKVQNNRP